MQLRHSQRRAAKMRLALQGASGSGKTYSSLLLACGMAPTGLKSPLSTLRTAVQTSMPIWEPTTYSPSRNPTTRRSTSMPSVSAKARAWK